MDADATDRFKLLIAIIGMVTLLGLLVIILLLVLWRRFNERQSALGRQRPAREDGPRDLWHESGQRLSHRLSAGGDATPDDDSDDDDPSTQDPRDDDPRRP